MRRESRRLKVVPRCDALEPRALLAAGVPSGFGAGWPAAVASTPGSPSPASTKPLLVAVVDSGVDLNTSDPIHVLGDAKYLDLADAYNAVDGTTGQDALGDVGPNKQGTRVVNEVLQGIASEVAAGGSSNVQVVPIRVYAGSGGDAPFYALLGGIYHAADLGAGVINVGVALNQNDLDAAQVQQFDQALEYARSKDAVVVVPAGDGFGPSPINGSTSVGVNIDQPGIARDMYPADFHLANMLVVAATDRSGNLVGSSNWGSTHVDLGVSTPSGDRPTGLVAGYASGVTAVVAATWSDWDAAQIVNRLKATAQPVAALAGKVTTGGTLNPSLALLSVTKPPAASTPDDYDGDSKADFAVYGYVPGTGGYGYAVATSTQGFSPAAATLINGGSGLGGPGTIPVPGAYYAKGVTQPAIYGPETDANGKPNGKYDFAILDRNDVGQYSVTTLVRGVGGPGDIPIVGDFLGDGRQDLGLYGYHGGQYNFWVLTAASNFNQTKMIALNNNGLGFGGPGSVPLVGDFFGNGKTDIAVYGPEYAANGQPDGKYNFAALDAGSKDASGHYTRGLFARGVGGPGDIPIVGDFLGDGVSDLALYGKHGGGQYNFLVLTSDSGFNPGQSVTLNNGGYGFGGPGSVPISGDFFGDGGTDIAVYGPQYAANGQPDGSYALAAIDLKSRNSLGLATKSLWIPGFGGPKTIPASAPPAVKWNEANSK